jgi:hypothetical protein
VAVAWLAPPRRSESQAEPRHARLIEEERRELF